MDSTQSGILRGILLALYHEKFHRLPRYPPQKFHRVRTRIAKAWSSTCASAAHPSTLCDRHATMTFLFKWHSFRSSHVWSTPRWTIHEVCTDSQKEMALCDESIMVRLLRPFQWWVFVAPTQWRNSCANDAPFVWLMCDVTPIYIIDEAYTDSRKKMAVCDESIMWSSYCSFPRREFFCGPHTMMKILCKWCSFLASHVWSYSWI